MDFGDDKQFEYPNNAHGMPMNTEGKTTGASVNAEVLLSERDTLRVGGEYQAYRLDDWWPPSGTGNMSPKPSGTSTTASVTATPCSANGKRSSIRNGRACWACAMRQ